MCGAMNHMGNECDIYCKVMFTQNWAHISQPEFDPEPKWKREKEKELKMIEIAE